MIIIELIQNFFYLQNSWFWVNEKSVKIATYLNQAENFIELVALSSR